MKTFPELLTKRLRLRNVQLNDIPAILKYANNKVISDNILNIPFPYKEEEVLYWIKKAYEGFRNNTRYAFAITLKELGELIGVIGLSIEQDHNKAELGFWVGEPYWGRGIMTEATEEILKFGFNEVNLNKIFGPHYVNNEASGKVLSKNGMSLFTSNREKRLWILVFVVVVTIYSTVGLVWKIATTLHNYDLLAVFFVTGMLLVGATIVAQGLTGRLGGIEIVITLGLIATFFMAVTRITLLEERSHLIEYSIVAVFIYEALKERKSHGA